MVVVVVVVVVVVQPRAKLKLADPFSDLVKLAKAKEGKQLS